MFSAIKVLLQLVITDRNEIFRPCEDIYSHLAHELIKVGTTEGVTKLNCNSLPEQETMCHIHN